MVLREDGTCLAVAGVSVRRVEDITEALWGTRVSPSTLIELNQQLYERIEAWRSTTAKAVMTWLSPLGRPSG